MDVTLKQLLEEYLVSLELGQHQKISDLSQRICFLLVEYYENELENENRIDNENVLKAKLEIIKSTNSILKEHAILAYAYSNVIDFVGVQDLVCLNSMLSAKTRHNKEQQTNESQLDFCKLATILRQSIYLLKYINREKTLENDDLELWVKKDSLVHINGIGLPIVVMDLEKSSHTMNTNKCLKKELMLLLENTAKVRENGELNSQASGGFLSSDWFEHFRERVLEERYPLDRFSILISIWIVGVESHHNSLEQLMKGLVDKIIHEEASSCNEEELMQLTQFGSFWLTHYKRYQVNFVELASLQCQLVADENDYEEDEDDDDVSEDDLNGDEEFNDEEKRLKTRKKEDIIAEGEEIRIEWNSGETRAKLRRLIDDELLRGVKCFICHYEPSELLEPISKYSCPGCNAKSFSFNYFCSLSFRPFPLTGLTFIFKGAQTKLRRLVLFTANEWARQTLLTCKERRENTYSMYEEVEEGEEMATNEKLDISEKFERLTVIRNDTRKSSSSSDGSSDSDGSTNSFSDKKVKEKKTESKEENKPIDVALNVMRTFMKARLMSKSAQRRASESIELLRWFQCEEVAKLLENEIRGNFPVFSPDFLILDSFGGLLKVCLVTSSRFWLSSGTIWSCMERAKRSELLLGCGRYFSSIELTQLDQSSVSKFICPFCDLSLQKVKNFNSIK